VSVVDLLSVISTVPSLLEALRKYLRLYQEKVPATSEEFVAYELKAAALQIMKTRQKAPYLKQIIENAERIAPIFIGNMKQTQPRKIEDLQNLLYNSALDLDISLSKQESDELIGEVTYALFNGLTRNYPLFENIALEEINNAKLETETADKLKNNVSSLSSSFTIKRKFNIDSLPGSYAKRVFVGGAYDDMPTLRLIEKLIQDRGFTPVIAYDFDIPVDMDVHDHDILLLHVCHYAIFELSVSAGQYNEVEWSVRLFAKDTRGLCKERGGEGKEKALQKVSSMVTVLFEKAKQPIYTYANFEELESVIDTIVTEWQQKK